MTRAPTPIALRCRATFRAVSPAPRISTRRSPSGMRADSHWVVVDATESAPSPMAVSARAARPVRIAARNTPVRKDPAPAQASSAARAWPSTSASPRTTDSRPAQTRNRWFAAASPVMQEDWPLRVSAAIPSELARMPVAIELCCAVGARQYTSRRLHVVKTMDSRPWVQNDPWSAAPDVAFAVRRARPSKPWARWLIDRTASDTRSPDAITGCREAGANTRKRPV